MQNRPARPGSNDEFLPSAQNDPADDGGNVEIAADAVFDLFGQYGPKALDPGVVRSAARAMLNGDMGIDKDLRRLAKRQSRLMQPGSNDHLRTTVARRMIAVTCAICGKDFEAVQVGRRQPSTRCSEECRREGRRRYSNAYAAAAKAELEELRARAAAGDLERFGIGRDGRPLQDGEEFWADAATTAKPGEK